MKKKSLLSEVRRLQKIAGLLKEDRFYAPSYIVQKYGEEKAKEIEHNIFDAEEMEGNPNLWDLFTSLQTPQEVDEFVQGFLKEDQNSVRIYDDAINYAYEMTPELMYEDGEFGSDVESLIQAEDEFKALLKAEQVNPASTLAYRRYWENALKHAKMHGDIDVEDFKIWFKAVAVESGAYEDNFNAITRMN